MLPSTQQLTLLTHNPVCRDRSLVDALRAVGYVPDEVTRVLSGDGMRDVLSSSARYSYFMGYSPELLAEPAGMLAQVFLLNGSAPTEAFRKTIPEDVRAVLSEARLIREHRDVVLSEFSVSPYQDLYFLADQIFTHHPDGRFEFAKHVVMPAHASTFLLLDNIPKRDWSDLIDLGCGSGALGLIARSEQARLLGIDIDPRAVLYSRLNAMLNGVTATYTTADARELDLPERRQSLLFNAPNDIGYSTAAEAVGRMSALDALSLAADTAVRLLQPGGRAHAFCLIQAPADGTPPVESVRRRLGDTPVEISLDPVESELFTVTAADAACGQLNPRSLLVAGAAETGELFRYMNENSIAEIRPAIATLSVRE